MTSSTTQNRLERRRAAACCLVLVSICVVLFSSPATAIADEKPPPARIARLEWNSAKTELGATFSFRDVVDSKIRRKLSRGLPTTIVLTAALYRAGSDQPVSTTAQTCKITWHVWNEAYRLEITRPAGSRTRWTTTLEGVLRRCAQAQGLLVATRGQVEDGLALYLKGSVQVNPISPKLLKKIKRWVSRPVQTGTAAPGDALFSTFTGLFMQRIGDAERVRPLLTVPTVPTVRPRKKKAGRKEG